jgi:hypothetical protein
MLQCTGTVDEFSKHFIALSCRDTSLSEAQQIQLFITGLGNDLCIEVVLQQPSSLGDATIFARANEKRSTSRDAIPPQPACGYGQSFSNATTTPTPSTLSRATSSMASTAAKPNAAVMRLSPAKIAQRRKYGKCFHCDELFSQGHKQQCKQQFVIEVLTDDINDEQQTNGAKPIISIHALTGIQPRAGRTMQVDILINGAMLWALLDSGSTHNFMDSEAAVRAGVTFDARGSGQWRPRCELRVLSQPEDRHRRRGLHHQLLCFGAGIL